MKYGTQLLVDRLSDEQFEHFEERAAIMEHEANLTQDEAEYQAVCDVLGIVRGKVA